MSLERPNVAPVLPTGARSQAVIAVPLLAGLERIPGASLALALAVRTRLVVWAAAVAAISIVGENPAAVRVLDPSGVTAPLSSNALNMLLAPAARWDSVWYLQIAAHGYFSRASANFFPLYPILIRIATPFFGNAILAGMAISLGSMVIALTLLYRLARLDLTASAAQLTVTLVAVFPASLFMSAVYPTSLFLMLTIGAVYAARREQWALAGLCGGLAAATRSNGILILVPLALMYLYGPRGGTPRAGLPGARWRPRFRVRPDVAWLGLVPVGLGVFLGSLYLAHGAPFAPYQAAHVDWDHSFGPPLSAIVDAIGRVPGDLSSILAGRTTPIGPGDPMSWQTRNLIDIVFLSVDLGGLALAWNRVPRVYVIYALLDLAQATSFPTTREPMIGLPRYSLPMLALFMGAGAYLAERRTAARITIGISAAILVLFSALWGYWSLVP